MANRIPAPLRTLGALLRALLGLSVLAALVVGVPYLLLKVGHQPGELTSSMDLLTQQDDGSVFFVVLTCIGWVAWAAFAFSVLVEVVAVLRRRSAPRIRGLGGMQSLATFLIGGIVLLAPTAASAATVAPAVAVTVTHTPGQDTQNTGNSAKTHAKAQTDGARLRHTVASATESPWEIAQKYLGSGPRWKDIAALNPAIPELAAGDQYLPKGAVLALPADARIPATTNAASSGKAADNLTADDQATSEASSYTVQPGDYLSKIAETELGDGDRWTELYEANKGTKQPYGHVFDDPDRIYPGQDLTLPAEGQRPGEPTDTDRAAPPREDQATPEEGARQASPRKQDNSSGTPDAQQEQRGRGGVGGGEAGAHVTSPAPTGSAAAEPGPSRSARPEAGATSSAPAPAPAESTAAAARADTKETATSAGMRAGMIGLAATGFLAAGMVGSLAYRRMMQQRRRRQGHRIAMPSGRSAQTEQALRSVDAGAELALLDGALRTAAMHLAQEGRPLPEITAVQLGERGMRLHLAAAVPPVAPFTTAPDRSTQWWCPARTGELLPAQELREVDPPFPALVALGEDEDGAIVLVDLEHVGALHLTGAGRLELLRTLALSLALTPLAEQMEIAVAGEDTAPGLSLLNGDRVTPYLDLGAAVRVLEAHQAEQQQALEGFGEGGALSLARPSQDVGELWPLIVLADLDTCPGAEQSQGVLWRALEAPVRSAMAIVTSSTNAPEAGGVWCVDTDAGEVSVPGSEVRVRLVAVTEEEYVDVLELGLTADSPTDHPAQPPAAAAAKQAGPAGSYDAGEQPGGPVPDETRALEGVRGPGLLAGIADLEDEPKDRPGEVESDRPTPEPLGQRAAAVSPGDVVLPTLSPTPRVSARLPQPVDTGTLAPAEGDETGIPGQTSPSEESSPLICVLGPVELKGARGTVKSNRRTLALELTAWLAFHPGANNHQIDEVIAPAGIVSRDTRNSRIGDVRKWLGDSPDGTRHLPHVPTEPDRLYRLKGVRCDWTEFQRLVQESHRAEDSEARQLLRQALELVRGRPFAGIPSRRYSWAESPVQEMVSGIVDAADDLADRCLKQGDGRGALWAAVRGLDAAREMECLWRQKFRALAMLGEDAELETAVRQLDALVLDLGSTMDQETEETLRLLESARH
ncbi:two-component SAPR family response regulator [Streptomyces sp. CEV 2-1]|uniref:BTAD domain-containing putative transcriptional regulator n=1 Tax=Streptomyces sp. CEV 2-1 TaxID=2485153 RepID=UPI000F4AE666|nr:BTAD domain-containing putative transcriptional regulator [Streptomyces sp. CEV 2-1]ROQ65232.1 two-component SAPR family response regulator [Streptomyces sp. CEV 2-1]